MKHAADYAAKFKGGTDPNQSGGYYYLAAGARRSMWSLYVNRKARSSPSTSSPSAKDRAAPRLTQRSQVLSGLPDGDLVLHSAHVDQAGVFPERSELVHADHVGSLAVVGSQAEPQFQFRSGAG